MKELSIEQKARAYDNIIEKANKMHCENCEACQMCIEELIPELREESEDERIRKEIVFVLKNANSGENLTTQHSIEEMLAWLEKQGDANKEYWRGYREGKKEILDKYSEHANFLNKIQIGDKVTRNEDGVLVNLSQLNRVAKKDEKQGEQKSDDVEEPNFFDDFRKTDFEIEPKFKVGDWVVSPNGVYWHIDKISNNRYEVTSNTGKSADWPFSTKIYHLWTIQDAKDGDVLVLNNEVFIYAHRKQMYSIAVAHCFVDSAGSFYLDGEFGYKEYGKTISPATKEQRDLLFQKMKEAGYEWNAEKKELRKIEQKFADKYEPMSLDEAIEHCKEKSCGNNACALEHKQLEEWLTELKKLKEQKNAWSEEDKKMFNSALWHVKNSCGNGGKNSGEFEVYNWLKSLKERYTWKPSNEQIEALESATENCAYGEYQDCLRELIKQLKKL